LSGSFFFDRVTGSLNISGKNIAFAWTNNIKKERGGFMKQKLTPLALGMCLLGMINMPVFAASDISARTQSLEQQVTQLQKELVSLRKELNSQSSSVRKLKQRKNNNTASSTEPTPTMNDPNPPQISGPSSLPQSLTSAAYLPIDLDVPGQSFVSSGPYLGIPLEYSGSNLIINSPSINEDVTLLKMRQNIDQRLDALGMHRAENKSHLLLSGFVEGQGAYIDKGSSGSSTNLDLSAANLDAYILGPSSWTSGLMEFAYDNSSGASEGSLYTNARAQNSRVFINKAFIIIGDFSKSPFYGTLGQMYVPFGVYSTTMVSSPLTKLLARTQARALNIGYQQQSSNALYGAIYMFKGDSHGSSTDRVNNAGLNIGYRLHTGPFSESFGAGVIANIADSQVMQNTGNQTSDTIQSANLFGGFGATGMCTGVSGAAVPCGNEKIVHRVPAYNLNAKFSFGHSIDVLAEYITSSTNFNPNDLAMYTRGARPQALHTEAIYSFESFARPTSIGAAYDLTKDALPLGLPAKRYSLALNTSIWRNTLESLEVRHDIAYSGGVTSSGSNAVGPQGTGRSDNVVTAQIDLYF
jgi:hypothetical protein